MTRGRLLGLALSALATLCAHRAPAQGLSGYAEARGFGYFSRATEREPWVIGWSTLLVRQEARLHTARLSIALRAESITSAERGPLVFDPADREARRTPISLPELSLRIPLAPFLDIQAGRFELGWGKTDGYSPADAFLPRDLSDPFADQKLPIWGVRALGWSGAFRLDAVAALTTTPWRLPVLEGRHAPINTGTALQAHLTDGSNNPPKDGFQAVRLLANLGDWDLGIWGRAGVRPAPLLTFTGILVTPDTLAIPAGRRYARESAAGFELSHVLGSFLVRAEGAALFSSDRELGDALIWTLGLERALGDSNILLTFAANAKGTPIDPGLLFDRGLLPALIGVFTRSEPWGNWKLVLTQALRHGDGLAKGEVAYNVTDVWRVTLGLDWPYGSRRGPFGARPDSRRAVVGVRRSW